LSFFTIHANYALFLVKNYEISTKILKLFFE
jgi:hypothetical protein